MQEVLLPAAIVAFEQALQAALTAGAEERRRAKDALAKVGRHQHQGHAVHAIAYLTAGRQLRYYDNS
jgi:hypothetical protein